MERYENCTVTITSVLISGRYLYRLRVWDSKGKQLIAIRIWADAPYKPGVLVRMHPEDMPHGH